MKYNPTTCPGPGDSATWGPVVSGNDPRAEPVEWDLMTDEQRREELEQLSTKELIDLLLEEFRK